MGNPGIKGELCSCDVGPHGMQLRSEIMCNVMHSHDFHFFFHLILYVVYLLDVLLIFQMLSTRCRVMNFACTPTYVHVVLFMMLPNALYILDIFSAT